MSVTSNSLFLAVDAPTALEGVGWQVRVLDNRDFTTVVAIINEYAELTIGTALNKPGAGSITLYMDTPFWSSLLPNGEPARTLRDREHLWEAWEDGILRCQWLGTNVEETILDETETQVVTISGSGAAEVLKWANALRPGYPRALPAVLDPVNSFSGDNTVPALVWKFPVAWSAMRMWWELYTAAKARGTLPWLNPTFTATHDSAGALWEYVPTVGTVSGEGYHPTDGIDLLAFLNECTGQDLGVQFAERTEWTMWPGFKLDVRKTIGSHREDAVVFYEGAIVQKSRSRVREQIANYVVVVDEAGGESLAADSTSINRWNKREQWQNKNLNITDPARRNHIANIFVEQAKDEKSQWTVRVPYDTPGRRPFRDYNIGDWIGVVTYNPGEETTVEPYRVLEMIIRVDNTSLVTVELTLQSRLELRQRQLEVELTNTINELNQLKDTLKKTLAALPGYGVINPGTLPGDGSFPGSDAVRRYGITVFIQPDDPGTLAQTGDFWYDTDSALPDTEDYVPDTPEYFEQRSERVFVPGVNITYDPSGLTGGV